LGWRAAVVPRPPPADAQGGGARPTPLAVGPAPAPGVRDRGPRCGGPRRILGAVTEPHAVRRLLAALGLAAEPPPGRPVPAA
jgi:hypothetical protein